MKKDSLHIILDKSRNTKEARLPGSDKCRGSYTYGTESDVYPTDAATRPAAFCLHY